MRNFRNNNSRFENRTGAAGEKGALLFRSSGSRRLLAMLCIACLVVLQCFVVMPALNGQVFAEAEITVNAYYKDNYSASRTVKQGWVENEAKSKKLTITVEGEDGQPVEETVTGYEIDSIVKQAGITSSKSVSPSGYVVFMDDQCLLYNDDGLNGSIEGIDVDRTKTSVVSFSKKPTIRESNPKVGDTIHIDYELQVDDFYDRWGENLDFTLHWKAGKRATMKKNTTTKKSGTVTAKITKAGEVNIRASSDNFSGLKADGRASTKAAETTKATTTTRYTTRPTTRYTTRYSPYRPTTRSGGVVNGSTTSGTGTGTTTATRPTETMSTVAPSYQTMLVKEVYLMPVSDDSGEVYYDEYGNPIEEDEWEDEWSDEYEDEWDEDGVSFPAAAGSAAVAAAACGAGAVGRVRRFRRDMGGIALAAAAAGTKAAADGRRRFSRKKKGENPEAEEAARAIGAKPENAKPETAKQAADMTATVKPEPSKSETAKPEAIKPEAARPANSEVKTKDDAAK